MVNALQSGLSKIKSAVKGVADLPGQDVQESAAIKNKMDQVNALKGQSAPAPSPAPKPAANLPVDRVNPRGKYGDRPGEKRIDVNKLDSYKKGGKIKKTKIVKVHAGERILTAKRTKTYDASPMAKGLSK